MISLKEYYFIVPALDLVSGYYNYDTWKATNDDWKTVYYAQFTAGGGAFLAILSAF